VRAREAIESSLSEFRRDPIFAPLLENAKHRFRRVEGILRVIGPDATLRRGYSTTMNERGKIIRTIAVRREMKIRARVSAGEFGSAIEM